MGRRVAFWLAAVGAACAAAPLCAVAQTAAGADWPSLPDPPGDPHAFVRGPGFYFSLAKLILIWVPFLAWVRMADWVNRDSQELGRKINLPYLLWNPIVVFPFVLALLLVLLIPIFWLGYPLYLAAAATPLVIYVWQRNQRVSASDQVFTPAHLQQWFQDFGRGAAQKQRREAAALPGAEGPPVEIAPAGADALAQQQVLIAARQSPAFVPVKELLADAIVRKVEQVLLDYTREACNVSCAIDGVFHALPPRDRASADMLLAVLKKLAGLNVVERRARQDGKFAAELGKDKVTVSLTSQGVPTGERVMLGFAPKKPPVWTLESLGMRPKMIEELKPLLNARQGFVLISAMPGGGLTTTWTTVLKASDRLLRDFVAIQDPSQGYPEIENLVTAPFSAAAGQTPDQLLPKIMLKQPDALVLPDLVNGATVAELCEQVRRHGKYVLASVRARDGVEAVLRVLALQAPVEPFARALTGVLSQRIVRKLCEACKEAYQPPPQMLAKLGLPPDRVQQLYKERRPLTPEEAKQLNVPLVCPECQGLGYRGRTAFFELFKPDDGFRQALVQTPTLEALRAAARKAGCRTLQDEGLVLAASGVTSVAELQRVLKT